MAPRHRHRRTTAVTALAAVALVVPVTVGCGAVEKALDCAQLAVDISNDVDNLQDALTGAAVDPQEADKVLDALDKDIDTMDDRTDNADVGKAVDDLQKAVDNVQKSVDSGDRPDLTPVRDAAGELTKVCTP
ncbi:hypothetical protein HUF15_17785 [Streptomyces samsunensis]|uniref:Secreted protein n=3 Tax=Streptomyces TaxID=1883 RepID=A0ABX6W5A6_STRMQ|nr:MULTISPECIES: hypothetical protein [Streptomyces]MYU10441.1 hypothetical protein [Streptomyces sp. SID8361]AQA12139.1 hypothetical protein BV401_18495 [Streptomyces autolyticus]ATL83200.1 secreted protein [Streptomyces malaysiensis]AUA13492.1 hypothetical protein CFP59_05654 [Streptomyces sp. M56]MCD9593506.1 hypothetical protein [Streptomyces sp. 8ZJF_21]